MCKGIKFLATIAYNVIILISKKIKKKKRIVFSCEKLKNLLDFNKANLCWNFAHSNVILVNSIFYKRENCKTLIIRFIQLANSSWDNLSQKTNLNLKRSSFDWLWTLTCHNCRSTYEQTAQNVYTKRAERKRERRRKRERSVVTVLERRSLNVMYIDYYYYYHYCYYCYYYLLLLSLLLLFL